MSRDPYAQREDDRAREDDEYARRLADERDEQREETARFLDARPGRWPTAACSVGNHDQCDGTTALGEPCACACHGRTE